MASKGAATDCKREERTPEDSGVVADVGMENVAIQRQPSLEHGCRELDYNDLEFGDEVGEGASGTVYKGNLEKKWDVAIKDFGKKDKTFKQEIDKLSKLKHPNIIKLYGHCSHVRHCYIITEFAERGSLYDHIQREANKGNPDMVWSLRWAADITEGMCYLHDEKVVHRDLKSANILLMSDRVAKICDFGIVREMDGSTTVTVQAGTHRWMAPEVINEERFDKSCDVFSFGMVLWELTTHKIPFEGKSKLDVQLYITTGKLPVIPDDIEYIAQLIEHCWKDRKARPTFCDVRKTLSEKRLIIAPIEDSAANKPKGPEEGGLLLDGQPEKVLVPALEGLRLEMDSSEITEAPNTPPVRSQPPNMAPADGSPSNGSVATAPSTQTEQAQPQTSGPDTPGGSPSPEPKEGNDTNGDSQGASGDGTASLEQPAKEEQNIATPANVIPSNGSVAATTPPPSALPEQAPSQTSGVATGGVGTDTAAQVTSAPSTSQRPVQEQPQSSAEPSRAVVAKLLPTQQILSRATPTRYTMDGKKLRVGFLSQHRALVRRLDTESLLPALVGEGLLSHDENTAIRHEVTGSQKSDSLLTVIHRLGFANPAVYVSFLKLLSDRFITAGQQLESLVQAINDDSVDEAIAKKFSNATDVLEENHNASLQAHKRTIVGSINVDEILPFLISEGVVTILEKEDINAKATVMERAELLLKVIRSRGSPAFLVFVRVLASLESYEHLARLLESPEAGGSGDDDEKYVYEVLKRGHVPPRYGVYVERKDMTQRIRRELVKLRETDGWVLVHGMAGFGKTVLAAEAVRNAAFLRENFPGGVHWLTVGKMTNRQGELDTAKLFTKVQTLILRLDSQREPRPLPTLEAAHDYLQKVISEQHPRSLLILDDVWSKEVAQCFAVRCRTMVTSRKSTVANSVTTPHLYTVSVSEVPPDGSPSNGSVATPPSMQTEQAPPPTNDVADGDCMNESFPTLTNNSSVQSLDMAGAAASQTSSGRSTNAATTIRQPAQGQRQGLATADVSANSSTVAANTRSSVHSTLPQQPQQQIHGVEFESRSSIPLQPRHPTQATAGVSPRNGSVPASTGTPRSNVQSQSHGRVAEPRNDMGTNPLGNTQALQAQPQKRVEKNGSVAAANSSGIAHPPSQPQTHRAAVSQSRSGRSTNAAVSHQPVQGQHQRLLVNRDDVWELAALLDPIAANWELFFGQLPGFPHGQTKKISANVTKQCEDPKSCFIRGLEKLCESKKSVTYGDIAAIMERPMLPNKPLARRIRRDYAGQCNTFVSSEAVGPLVENYLHEMAASWKMFLRQLRMPGSEVDQIEGCGNYAMMCLSTGLEFWLLEATSPTYQQIAGVLRGNVVTNYPLARKVEEFAKNKCQGSAEVSYTDDTHTPPSPQRAGPVVNIMDQTPLNWEVANGFKWINQQRAEKTFRPTEIFSDKWEGLGKQFGYAPAVLRGYERECLGNNERCFKKVIDRWLEKGSDNYAQTWSGLCEALKDVGGVSKYVASFEEAIRNKKHM